MKKILKGTAVFIGIIVGAILSGVVFGAIGLGIGSLQNKGYFVTWKSLGSTPEQPFRIIDASLWEVIVFAPSGQTFRFVADDVNWRTGTVTGHWVPTLKTRVEEPSCYLYLKYVPPPPMQAIDTREGNFCYEVRMAARYAILEDGSVWRWGTRDGMTALLDGVWGIICGLFVCPFAILVYVLRRRRRLPGTHEPKALGGMRCSRAWMC
jgi:hypothetical protein